MSKESKVIITAADCEQVMELFTHLDIPIPEDVKAALAAFKVDGSYENQQQIKLAMCRAIGFSSHSVFKDEDFAQIVEEARGIVYDVVFDKELEATLASDEDHS